MTRSARSVSGGATVVAAVALLVPTASSAGATPADATPPGGGVSPESVAVVASAHPMPALVGVVANAPGLFDRAEARRQAAERAAEARAAKRLAKKRDAAKRSSRSTTRLSGSPRAIGRSLASDRGWGGRQFACLDRLWTKESNWQTTADNPTSSAYGIPQALPGRRMASHGRDWRTNPSTQIRWGLDYIADRYGTPCAAWAHSRAYNWY